MCILTSVLFFYYKVIFSDVCFISLPLRDLYLFFEHLSVYYSNFSLSALPFILSKTKDTHTKFRNMTDSEFKQWFVGFTDAEGCFRIAINNKKKVISFNFSILLHIDDQEALEFIKNRLNCGNVYASGKTANLVVTKVSDILNILIPIFEEFPLNGVKYLDYLAFKEAAINIKLDLLKSEKLDLIAQIKDNMNSKRVNFELPSSHTIIITPY